MIQVPVIWLKWHTSKESHFICCHHSLFSWSAHANDILHACTAIIENSIHVVDDVSFCAAYYTYTYSNLTAQWQFYLQSEALRRSTQNRPSNILCAMTRWINCSAVIGSSSNYSDLSPLINYSSVLCYDLQLYDIVLCWIHRSLVWE